MEGYVSEDEQVERLRKWWQDYGRSVLLGLVLGFAAWAGIRWYLDRGEMLTAQASLQYAQMLDAVEAEQPGRAIAIGEALITQTGSGVYGTLAALEVARLKLDSGDTTAAGAHLRWAVENADEARLAALARLRLAGLLAATGKADEAEPLLAPLADDPAFAVQYHEARGDIQHARGQAAEARAAYDAALAVLPDSAAAAYRELLQFKRDRAGS